MVSECLWVYRPTKLRMYACNISICMYCMYMYTARTASGSHIYI